MKGIKRLGYFGIMVCFNLFLFLTVVGLAHAVISVDLGSASGPPGSDVTIPITLNYGGADPNISGTSNDIGYNTVLLENPSAVIGPAGTAANKQVQSSTPSQGLFRVGVIGLNQNIIQGGIVANVTFKIKTTAPQGDIPLTNTATATSPSGNPVTVGGGAGTITVVNPTITASISGGHGNANPHSQSVNHGANATINITPDPGYKIHSIKDNGVSKTIVNPYVISSVTENHDVVVIFTVSGDKWSGPTAFSVKVSELADPDKSGNIKFKSVTESFVGTVELYYGLGEIIPDEEGCYIKIVSDDGNVSFCFNEIAGVVTQYVKFGSTDTFYLKAIGSVRVIDTEEVPAKEFTGVAFLDLTKGTLKRDKITNNVTSIILSGKIAGGSHGDFVFSATIKATLTKE